MSQLLYDVFFPLVRWLHIVCMTLIVGGTLFYELVLPQAIEDVAREEQLFAMARARLVFRWVVWISVIVLLATGIVQFYRMWQVYHFSDSVEFNYILRWIVAHSLLGIIAMVVALLLTIGRRPPEDPVRWMRLNLIILLVAIFLGSATRHFQMTLRERPETMTGPGKMPDSTGTADTRPATEPATEPATRP
jgi:uncharacterized membrane protein